MPRILFVNVRSCAGEIVFNFTEYSSGYAALRSAFVPGWGQAYEVCLLAAAVFYFYAIANAYLGAKKYMRPPTKVVAFNFYYNADNEALS